MRVRMRQLSALLVLMLMARAAIPLGYMLEADASTSSHSMKLVFCPLQNASLDLSLFQRTGGSGTHDHGHHHGAALLETENQQSTLAAMGDCGQWLNSQFVAQPFDNRYFLGDSLLSFDLTQIAAASPLPQYVPTTRHSRAPPFFS